MLPEDPGKAHWPASKEAYVPPFVKYFQELNVWLKTFNQQWAVAAVAFAFGLLNLLHGVASYRLVLTSGFALMATASAQYEVTLVWPDVNMPQQIFIMAEVGLLTAIIVYMSMKGFNTLLGVMLGLGISALLETVLHTEDWHLNISVIWYSVWALMGVISLTYFQRRTLAVLTPLVGSFLISSSMGYLVTLATWYRFQQPHPGIGWLVDEKNVHGDCWVDFAGALLGSSKKVGIFPEDRTPNFTVDIDRDLGRLLWLALYYAGAKWQWYCAKKKTEKEMKDKSFCMSLKQPLVKKVSDI